MSESNGSKRVQFDLSREKLAELDRLQRVAGFDTRKELFNNALTLFKWAMTHALAGHGIAAVDEGTKKYYELQMPFLAHIDSTRDNLTQGEARERLGAYRKRESKVK